MKKQAHTVLSFFAKVFNSAVFVCLKQTSCEETQVQGPKTRALLSSRFMFFRLFLGNLKKGLGSVCLVLWPPKP